MGNGIKMSIETKKYIEMSTCPCCNVKLDGLFYGNERQYEFKDRTIFYKFDFNCPSKNRRIALLECKEIPYKVFWLVEQESILSKYLVKDNKFVNNSNMIIFYLYYPYNVEPDFNMYLKAKLEEVKKNHIVGLVYPRYLKKYLDPCKYNVDIEWTLDDKMFEYCKGTVYNSILAEANIVNESHKWLRCKLLSNYPTLYPEFECFNNVDLEMLKKIII